MPDTIIQKEVYFEVFCTNDSCPPLTSQQAKSNNHYEYYIIQQPAIKNTGLEMMDWIPPISGLIGVVLGFILIAFRDSLKTIKSEDDEINNLASGLVNYSDKVKVIASDWNEAGEILKSSKDNIQTPLINFPPNYTEFLIKTIDKIILESALKRNKLVNNENSAYNWTIDTFNAFESINYYRKTLKENFSNFINDFSKLDGHFNDSIYNLHSDIINYNLEVKTNINVGVTEINQLPFNKIILNSLNQLKEIKGKKVKVFNTSLLSDLFKKIGKQLDENENMCNMPSHRDLQDKILKLESLLKQSISECTAFAMVLESLSNQMNESADKLLSLLNESKILTYSEAKKSTSKRIFKTFSLLIKG
jgi:hypothetical protein